MIYIIRNKKSLDFNELKKYPGKDESKPLQGLDDNLEIYKLIDDKPVYDTDRQIISIDGYLFTDSQYNEHIKIANVNYILTDISQDEIIKRLNESLGNHLDTSYPFWEQNKHSGKGLRYISTLIQGGTPTHLESDYINNKVIILADWARRCREERDNRENGYREKDIFPSFEWEKRPIT